MSFEQEELIRTDIHAFLRQHEQKELLRFVTVGSVDDGKSTLIGRLLHDAKGVYEDQLKDASTLTEEGEVAIDFARITDGLQAEREQGITIDVAYRYFSTPRRKFIIADTPGHVQYTRNMATGASTANVAIILIDARLGVLQQSRRHAYIASLLGIPHLLVCVNKMDLADYGQERFTEITDDFRAFAGKLAFESVTYVPISALLGVNIIRPSDRTPWYDGPTVMQFLEEVPIARNEDAEAFRYPVQYVLRPNLDYRGFAGQIASGVIRKGDAITALPSGKTSRVRAIDTYDGELEEAWAPMSVTLRLEDEIDISRGDMIVRTDALPEVSRSFEANVVWLSETPLDPGKSYLIKHTTRYVRTSIEAVRWKVDLETLDQLPTESLQLNDIGRLQLTAHRPIVFDPYAENRTTGAFIIIDTMTNNSVGAGMIQRTGDETGAEVTGDAQQPRSGVSQRERVARLHQQGAVVWFSGLPASGCSSLAYAVERLLFDRGYLAAVIDSKDAPNDASRQLVTDPELVADQARRFADTGLIALCAVDADRRDDRELARVAAGSERFFEVHVCTDEATCSTRATLGTHRDVHGCRGRDVPVASEGTAYVWAGAPARRRTMSRHARSSLT